MADIERDYDALGRPLFPGVPTAGESMTGGGNAGVTGQPQLRRRTIAQVGPPEPNAAMTTGEVEGMGPILTGPAALDPFGYTQQLTQPTEPASVVVPTTPERDLSPLLDKMNEPPDQDALDAEDALAKKILAYLDNLMINHAMPAPLSFGEAVAIGLLGGLDQRAFQEVVLPLLARERDLPRQAVQDQQRQAALQIQALESLAQIYGTRAARAQSAQFREREIQQRERLAGQAQRAADKRQMRQLATAKELKGLMIPPPIEKDWRALVDIEASALEAIQVLTEHPIAGGYTAGVPGAQQVSGAVSLARTALDNVSSSLRREKFGTAQTATELSSARGFIPFAGDSHQKKMTNLRKIVDNARAKRRQIERLHPQLNGMSILPEDQATGPLQLEAGDVPVEFEIPDSELGEP